MHAPLIKKEHLYKKLMQSNVEKKEKRAEKGKENRIQRFTASLLLVAHVPVFAPLFAISF